MLSKFFGSGRGVDRPDQPDQPDRPDHEPAFGRHGTAHDGPSDGAAKAAPTEAKGVGDGGGPGSGHPEPGDAGPGHPGAGASGGPVAGADLGGPSTDPALPVDFGGGSGAPGPYSPPPADDLGWDEAAFDEAGGFEALLGDALLDWLNGAGDDRPAITVNIDTIDIDLFNIVQNTLVQNTQVLFDASGGGSVMVGGDVMAFGVQEALVADAGGFLPI